MTHPLARILVPVVALGLGAAVLGLAPAGAEEPAEPAGAVSDARGLIVKTAEGIEVVPFTQPLTEAGVERAVQRAEQSADVEWAEPDVPIFPAALSFPDDEYFSLQWGLWDFAAAKGGYSTRAPRLWNRTVGDSDIVVAIIDTGLTAHPDLAGQAIPGYDFVSDVAMANDGNGWDPDPADPGDWVTSADIASGTLPEWCGSSFIGPSSWHGTHVSGIVAAIRDNVIGVSGAAPGVRLQTVRALGKCGGFASDLAAAITWASGGSVPGVPDNPTPADVVNMSLGGASSCLAPVAEAIDGARARGVVVVAAAGNNAQPIATFLPANCPGVVPVTSIGADGVRAPYSNYGTAAIPAFIATPGTGVFSTFNSGTQAPAVPDYAVQSGTSMAAPFASAAIALALSLRESTATDAIERVRRAVQVFPRIGYAGDCDTTSCGAGILDLGRLMAGLLDTAGERGVRDGKPAAIVRGTTAGIPEGTEITIRYRFAKGDPWRAAKGTRAVRIVSGDEGTFTWSKQMTRRIYVQAVAATGELGPRLRIPGA